MTVVGGDQNHGAFLMLEASVDGSSEHAIDIIATQLRGQLDVVLEAASVSVDAGGLKALLQRHSHDVGHGLFDTPGLCFSGTPGMSVERIKREYELGRAVRDLLAKGNIQGTPLQILKAVRAQIAGDPKFSPLMQPESVALLAPAPPASGLLALLPKIVWGAVKTFFWPYLLLAGIVVALMGYLSCPHGWLFVFVTVVVCLIIAVLVLIGIVLALYLRLRAREASDEPDDATPDRALLAEVMKREDDGDQNHLAGVSIMKPGMLRGLTLRFAYFFIATLAKSSFRPGFLADIGTIHFARWILVPGTNKLLFFSNYGGSWESYLEDFVTKASAGLTSVWSNTLGYPRTSNLFFDGATDGDRFKRWARRQQRPTWFWYSAYPNTTTARIRINAAIRHGLVSASTEDEAADWLSQLGSRTRSVETIQSKEVQAIMFGGMGQLADAACLLLRLPDDPVKARAWLAEVEGEISFGDELPAGCARILSFTNSGLQRLGLPERQLEEFPIAFRQGMHEPHRAKSILADTGPDKPALWTWGNGTDPIDAALLLYAEPSEGQATLTAQITKDIARLQKWSGAEVHRIDLKPIPDRPTPVTEAFNFVDGVSQPIIRGTRRWLKSDDAIHVVAPGEFILGYPDNRGYLPTTPTVPATDDPNNVLPVVGAIRSTLDYPSFERSNAGQPHDLGVNGSFMVIRQLAQDVEKFGDFVSRAANTIKGRPGTPAGYSQEQLEQWVAAKLVGRWRDGTSLVRYPHRPGTGWNGELKRALAAIAHLLPTTIEHGENVGWSFQPAPVLCA